MSSKLDHSIFIDHKAAILTIPQNNGGYSVTLHVFVSPALLPFGFVLNPTGYNLVKSQFANMQIKALVAEQKRFWTIFFSPLQITVFNFLWKSEWAFRKNKSQTTCLLYN